MTVEVYRKSTNTTEHIPNVGHVQFWLGEVWLTLSNGSRIVVNTPDSVNGISTV